MRTVLRGVLLVLVSLSPAGCRSEEPAPGSSELPQGPPPAVSADPDPPRPPVPVVETPREAPSPVGEPSPHPAPVGVPHIELLRKSRTASLPKGVVSSPDGATLFVTNFGRIKTWNIFAYEAETMDRKGIIDFEGNGVEMAFSPDGTRLYASNFRKHLLMEIDPDSLEVLRTFPVGKNPKTLAVSPDGRRVYVSNWTSDTVTVVDVEAGEVLGHVHSGNQPRGIDVSPDGRRVYVSNCAGNTVTMIDAESLTALKTVKLKKHGPTKPRHVVVSPDGALVYVTAQAVGFLYVLDSITLEVVGKARTGSGPKTVDITPDGLFAFTANFTGDSITSINLATYESRTTSEPVVRAPCGLAVSPAGDRLWVTGWHARWLGEYSIEFPEQVP